MRRWTFAAGPVAMASIVLASSCAADRRPAGTVRIDGSSTVFPITEAVAEEYRGVAPKVRVTVGISGTGGGFKKFCAGETDINDASRPIEARELQQARAQGIQFIELPVAYDGLTVVVNTENVFVDKLTVAELHEIWRPDSPVKTWRDVRPAWPDEEIHLYGPGHDSGTFDYFTQVVNGKSKVSRADYTASEDDNVLAQGVAGDSHSLGYFGYAYFEANATRLRAVPIDGGAGPVSPSVQAIRDGTYAPLSRPIFVYVSKASAARPEVASFVEFYLRNMAALAEEVGYIPLPESIAALTQERWTGRVTGTVFPETRVPGESLEKLMAPLGTR